MNKQKKVDTIFRKTFLLGPEEPLEDKDVLNVEAWNSIEHFAFITEIEREFKIELRQEDIVAMTSYSAVLDILRKYGVSSGTR